MTREEILSIAKVTGPIVNSEGWLYGGVVDLEKFANVIAKIEREKCALICDEFAIENKNDPKFTYAAKYIREREKNT